MAKSKPLTEQEAKQWLGSKYPEPRKREHKGKKGHKPAPRHQPGVMNRTESEYAEKLKADPGILYYLFERVKFKLADKTWYTPDFFVVTEDECQVHEVKGGYCRDDARVKWKTIAEQHPHFRFFMATKRKKQWEIEEYGTN